MRPIITLILITLITSVPSMAAPKTAHDFTLTAIDGTPLPLAQFAGKVLLVVNTASECGYTPQYEGLEALWQAYRGKGLVIVGVPSNDFGGQEPGTAEQIANFCKVNYGVTFPLADKTVVKGKGADPFYVWAGAQAGEGGAPKWNFHKYLLDEEGRLLAAFMSSVSPFDDRILSYFTS